MQWSFFGARQGYTLIELLIVLAIVAILSGILLTYSGASHTQLSLYTDEQKVVGLLNRAKTFALEKRVQGVGEGVICAFGVHFAKPATVILFKDLSSTSDCTPDSHNYIFDGSSEQLDTLALSPTVQIKSFAAPDSASRDVTFEAPYLTTRSNGSTVDEIVTLQIAGTGAKVTIEINPGGAITAQ